MHLYIVQFGIRMDLAIELKKISHCRESNPIDQSQKRLNQCSHIHKCAYKYLYGFLFEAWTKICDSLI